MDGSCLKSELPPLDRIENTSELKNEINLSKSSIISKLKNITSSPALQIVNESNDMDVSNNNNNSSSNNSRIRNSSSTINTISSTLSSDNIMSSKRMRNSSHKKVNKLIIYNLKQSIKSNKKKS
jgi:hypothetical protein